ncbi:MAG: hypothetical protein MOIL_01809 [Candidatus Methanolliviera sp. GoM_oil]|nr:MAG: hypothetical protein MOIL_01809 [Candidatus Methanolliviera sp. GoM_oil]
MPERVRDAIKRVRRLEIATKQMVEGLMAGYYHSVFKGRGIEFSDIREYVAGDDIRAIDWNVTARMNAPFVKEFIEERDLTVHIVLDISASSEFGFERRKRDVGIEIAASLIFSALTNNDRVGMFLCTSEVEEFIPPRKGRSHLFKLLKEMIYFTPENKTTDLDNCIRYVSKVTKRKSTIFIISDFITEDFEKSLRILKNRHEVILVNVSDVRESDIPDIGYVLLEDGETGEQFLLDTSDKGFRERYTGIVRQRNEELSERMRRRKVDMINIRTDQPFEIPLRRFFRMKKRRMR